MPHPDRKGCHCGNDEDKYECPKNKDKCCEKKQKCLRKPDYHLLNKCNTFDNLYKERYIPERPTFLPNPPYKEQYIEGENYPWFLNTIPTEPLNEGTPIPKVPGTPIDAIPNRDAYDKFKSISAYIHFYAGFDFFTMAQDNPRSTLFLTNLERRGSDNYLKKVYMNATNCEVLKFYKDKTNNFVNELYASCTINRTPVLSKFRELLIKYFLDIHLGTADHPKEVVDYFTIFTDIIGIGRGNNTPERNDLVMYGWVHIDCVNEYFAQRLIDIAKTEDKSTIAYWWLEGGLTKTALISECLHNMIAFLQFSNSIFLIARDQVSGTPFPPPIGVQQYNFLDKYREACNEKERVNVAREAMRLLSPNAASFSHINEEGKAECPPPLTEEQSNSCPWIQSRHLNQLIMVQNAALAAGNPAAYFQYNPDQYNENFSSNLKCNTCSYNCTCEYDNPLDIGNVEKKFTVSPVDGQTVIDISKQKLIPVFDLPTYMPFGLGYRRCAGEPFSMFVIMKLLDRFKDTRFVFNATPTTPTVPLAPFVIVPDNLFVQQNLLD